MLAVSHLRKRYASLVAVDDVSLQVQRGKILGLLGPNGAGKTTTIRMIVDIVKPDSGTITFDGIPFNENIRNLMGYLPEERGLYRKSRLQNTILHFARLKGLSDSEAARRSQEWLDRLNLWQYQYLRIDELSKGNQQKVQFIVSILHDPQLIILDEPFSGLDPVNQIVLKDILLDLKRQNKAIILSTHQMDDAEKLCDEICLINHGKVVLDGNLSSIKNGYGKNSIHLEFDGDGTFLRSLSTVKKALVYEHFAELVLDSNAAPTSLLQEISRNIEIRKYERSQPSLQSIFLEIVSKDGGSLHEQTKVG